MKPRTHIRIVCLKNETKNKPPHHQSGLIVAGAEKDEYDTEDKAPTPSLAYLSARLQFGNNPVDNSEGNPPQRELVRSGVTSYKTLEMTETKSRKIEQQPALPTIERFI